MTDRCELNTNDSRLTADTRDALSRVLDYGAQLGLHGVMILSPRCARCGQLHDFQMVTDLSDTPGDAEALRDLLRQFADLSMQPPTEEIDGDALPRLS